MPLTAEQAAILGEELRLLLRRRDQLSLQAARLAGQLAEAGYGDAMGSISIPDWIRHEFHLGYQAAATALPVPRWPPGSAQATHRLRSPAAGGRHSCRGLKGVRTKGARNT